MTVDELIAACDALRRRPVRTRAREVLPMIAAYRALGLDHLRPVIDDYYYDNGYIVACRRRARAAGDKAGVALARLLLRVPKDRRLDYVCRGGNTWTR